MIELPSLGMGTATLGNLYRVVSDAEAFATMEAAIAAGIGYFDTAPHYGFGLSERRLGASLEQLGSDHGVLVSTKVGRLLLPTDAGGERHGFVEADPFEPHFDYSHDAVLRSFDGSRTRLRRDRINLLLAHDLGRLTHGAQHDAHLADFLDGGYRAMRDLRDQGAIGAIGIGVNEVAICEELLDRIELDAILIAGRFTLLDRGAEQLLDRCAKLNVQVIVGGPYNSGILARELTGPLHFDYAEPSAAVLTRARAMAQACERFGVPLPAAALQFPLRHPQVACVIPGLVGKDQVNQTIERFGTPVPNELWSLLEGAATDDISTHGQTDVAI